MTAILKHATLSLVADENNPNEIGPAEWNASHVFSGVTQNLFLVGNGVNGGVADRPIQGIDLPIPTPIDRGGVFSFEFRGVRSAPVNLYVRNDGSDNNDGSANNSGGAFLTWNKAIDTATKFDLGASDTTIHIADGSYGAPVVCKPFVSSGGKIIVLGNVAAPDNVTLTVASNFCINATDCAASKYVFKGMKLSAPTAGYSIIYVNGSDIEVDTVNFGVAGVAHMLATNRGRVGAIGSYSISGGGQFHILINGRSYAAFNGRTVTIANSPTFTNFIQVSQASLFEAISMTFPGTGITGTRYSANGNSVIDTNGGGANYFPGTVPGNVSTGAQYI
jgi:hypothetical protein